MQYWLISTAELREVTNDYKWDWVRAKFNDNGIISPEDALFKIHGVRFKYFNEDCPFCKSIDKHYESNSELWKCKRCSKKFTITSRTYLDGSKLAYYHWYRFAYLVAELEITNSSFIAKDLDISQKTAWGMLDLLRRTRKETTKFTNGSSVFNFENLYEILELLLTFKKEDK